MIPKGMKCCLGRRMGLVRPDNSKLDSRFLYYYFFSPEWRRTVVENTISGATVDRLPIKTFPSFPISLPPLSEQRRIVGILSAYDDLIENNRKRIALLEESARLIYRKWFIGVPHRHATMGDLLETIESGSRPRGGAESSGVPSIGAEKVESIGIYDYSSEKYVSEEYYKRMKRGKLQSGDVLLYKDGAYTGKVSMSLNGFPHERAAVNEHVFILRTHNMFAQCFLYCFMRRPEVYSQINTLASAKSCQPGLNQNDMLTLEIELPPDDAIVDFERMAIPLFEKVVNLSKQSRVLAAARDALLPRLMKGGVA